MMYNVYFLKYFPESDDEMNHSSSGSDVSEVTDSDEFSDPAAAEQQQSSSQVCFCFSSFEKKKSGHRSMFNVVFRACVCRNNPAGITIKAGVGMVTGARTCTCARTL